MIQTFRCKFLIEFLNWISLIILFVYVTKIVLYSVREQRYMIDSKKSSTYFFEHD